MAGSLGTGSAEPPRKVGSSRGIGVLAALALLLGSGAQSRSFPPAPLAPGSRYVAMGSSFAAGPAIGSPADVPNNRCDRSADNYAHQLARKRDLQLIDVSCGGATTAHLLGPWGELPPQLDALTPDTKLVTITIGGNDVDYIGGLFAGSCGEEAQAASSPICRAMRQRAVVAGQSAGTAASSMPTEAFWRALAANMDHIASEVRRRSPRARLIFVDYLTIIPDHRLCPVTPLSAQSALRARIVARRLAALTTAAARKAGADLVRASAMSAPHDACSNAPWITGFVAPAHAARFMPYHPDLAGMTAIATAIDRLLGPR